MGEVADLIEERAALEVIDAPDHLLEDYDWRIATTPATDLEDAMALIDQVLIFRFDRFAVADIAMLSHEAQVLLGWLKSGEVYRGYIEQLDEIASAMVCLAPNSNPTKLLLNVCRFYRSLALAA